MEVGALARVHVFPVRHHSPRSSAVLSQLLDEVKPRVVLVEGPDDATHLLEVLASDGTRPPVAILAHRTDRTRGSALWPFASYSPEYVAARWSFAHGAEVAFIDVPAGRVLASFAGHASEGGGAEPEAPRENVLDVPAACAKALGVRSFEEFWEASFEAPAHDAASFRAALLAYATLVRAEGANPMHRARDAYMAKAILAKIDAGVAPEQIVAVMGAAHAAAVAEGTIDFAHLARLPRPVPSTTTLIPFSFPRLAEQLGYGAGNRAPMYYQRAHDAGCSFARATLEVLVEFTEELRLRGFMASLADTIEAYRLAVSLAELRGKAEPGLDELREATIATLCRGDATHVDGFLWPSVIGRHVGKVAQRVGKNSLEVEFWREIEARGLPTTDSLEAFSLRLNQPLELETSAFLHRLRIANVPYAHYVGKHLAPWSGTPRAAAEGKAELDDEALTHVTEAWEVQWTPATDVALVDRIVLGSTLEEVVGRVLDERLFGARTAADAASALREAVFASVPRAVPRALAACDRCAATDDDLPSLARSASILFGLLAYRSARAVAAGDEGGLQALLQKVFTRAVLRVRAACTGSDAAVAGPRGALRTLHDVARAQQQFVEKDAWLSAARSLAVSYQVNPGAAGLAAGLLCLAGEIDEDGLARMIAQRVSETAAPARAAAFVDGFLEVNAYALVKSRAVVAALDGFLSGIDAGRFRDALPVLRRAFGRLAETDRRYLLENVLALRRSPSTRRTAAAQAVLAERDKAKLRAMSTDLAQAMEDMDDLV
jgi:hypothetical protein